jgi:hypothetical protein
VASANIPEIVILSIPPSFGGRAKDLLLPLPFVLAAIDILRGAHLPTASLRG